MTGGSGVIDINGQFTLSGGTFTASSGSTFFANRFKRDPGGAFLHNGGTVVFDGNVSVDQTLNPAVTFNYRLLFSRGPALTIGEAVMRAKSLVGGSDIRRTWVLLGDPAMKLRR